MGSPVTISSVGVWGDPVRDQKNCHQNPSLDSREDKFDFHLFS